MNELLKGRGGGESTGIPSRPLTPTTAPWTGAQQAQGFAILGGLLIAGAHTAYKAATGKGGSQKQKLENISLAEEPSAQNELRGWVYFPKDDYEGTVVTVEVRDATNQPVRVAEIRTNWRPFIAEKIAQ